MLTELTSQPYVPFTVAFFLMLGVGLVEAIGTGLGHLDLDADSEIGGSNLVLLDWLGIGSRLPLLIWITSFLGCFSVIGIMLQQTSTAFLGAPVNGFAAAAGALVLGLLANKFVSNGIARIFPAYESSVISTDDLVMRRGTILEGTARRNHPARAKVLDQHKQAHFIMVEPQYDSDTIGAGQTALLVRKEGNLFFGLPDVNTTLTPVP